MINPELRDSLKIGALGNALDDKEFKMLLEYNKTLQYKPGERILTQGKKTNAIYIILSGSVKVTAKILGQGIAEIEKLKAGEFLGEISFIEDCPCATSVTATEPTQCLLLNTTYFELVSSYYPETKYKLMYAIACQVRNRLKTVHDNIVGFIQQSDMIKRSFFGEILHSLNKTEEISLEKAKLDANRLKASVYFQSFTVDEINELLKNATCIAADTHCTLMSPEMENTSWYIVIHGAVQSSIVHDNKSAKLSVIGPGILFAGVSSVDSDSAFTITFATCEKAVLLMLTSTMLDMLKQTKPQIWYKLFDLVTRSLIALEKSIDKLDIRLQIEVYNR